MDDQPTYPCITPHSNRLLLYPTHPPTHPPTSSKVIFTIAIQLGSFEWAMAGRFVLGLGEGSVVVAQRAVICHVFKAKSQGTPTHPPTHPPTHLLTHPPISLSINQSINPPTHPPSHLRRGGLSRYGLPLQNPLSCYCYPSSSIPRRVSNSPTHPPTHSPIYPPTHRYRAHSSSFKPPSSPSPTHPPTQTKT